jgi:fatty acyl-CoA reductase
VEKLVYQCADIGKIFILMRSKRGQEPNQRLEEFLKCEYFSKRLNPNDLRSKLDIIEGDITQPQLGISPEDREKLINCVSVVIHSAASVKFDDPLE